MCRNCIIPDCEVLLATPAPMCAAHWNRVPQKIQDAIARAEEQERRATSEHAKNVFRIERQAAFDMAIQWASKTPRGLMGRGSGLPSGAPVGPMAG